MDDECYFVATVRQSDSMVLYCDSLGTGACFDNFMASTLGSSRYRSMPCNMELVVPGTTSATQIVLRKEAALEGIPALSHVAVVSKTYNKSELRKLIKSIACAFNTTVLELNKTDLDTCTEKSLSSEQAITEGVRATVAQFDGNGLCARIQGAMKDPETTLKQNSDAMETRNQELEDTLRAESLTLTLILTLTEHLP